MIEGCLVHVVEFLTETLRKSHPCLSKALASLTPDERDDVTEYWASSLVNRKKRIEVGEGLPGVREVDVLIPPGGDDTGVPENARDHVRVDTRLHK